MKEIGYKLLFYWVKAGLFCYYKKQQYMYRNRIPKTGAVMFLGNHQNALIDSLFLAVNGVRDPYFLARSDVFSNAMLSRFLGYLKMMPVYRIRDGIKTLKGNDAIFNQCADLLNEGKAIALFPEGNHSLKRRVRPLSKGFTRILFLALEKYPDLEITLVPVGNNYQHPSVVGDKVNQYFGHPIALKEVLKTQDVHEKTLQLKKLVFDQLSTLTTHIDHEEYDAIITALEAKDCSFLDPEKVNQEWPKLNVNTKGTPVQPNDKQFNGWAYVFTAVNFLTVLPWRQWIKPGVKEKEFVDTLRFGYALVSHTVLYLISYILLVITMGQEIALITILTHFIFNLLYVKYK